MYKAIITNFGSSLNKGSEALLLGQIDILKKAKVKTVAVACYYKDLHIQGLKKIDLPGLSYRYWLDSYRLDFWKFSLSLWRYAFALFRVLIWRLFNGLAKKKTKTSLLFILPKPLHDYIDIDLVVNTGGDVITSDYGTLGLLCYLSNLYLPLLMGKPILFLGETVGPFKEKITEKLALFLLRRSLVVFVRDIESYKFLKRCGLKNIRLIADPAFLVPAASKSEFKKVLEQENISFGPQDKLVGIVLSEIIYCYLQGNNSVSEKKEKLIKIFVQTIRQLLQRRDVKIILISHVFGPCNVDDRCLAQKIVAYFSNNKRVFVLKHKHSFAEIKSVIGQLKLLISCRMHPLIAAVSQGIPVVPIAYSRKFYGVIGKGMGLAEFVIDINELTVEKLGQKINLLLNKRKQSYLQEKLQRKNLKNKKLIFKGVNFLTRKLNSFYRDSGKS
ncbi:polysaccharide pyruvyl transferase family protein [bacterium]|nr:polysaccharide pyruvyl transferase family protein [bacterium]